MSSSPAPSDRDAHVAAQDHIPAFGASCPCAKCQGSTAQGRDEATAIYAALRRSGAGFPAFWKAMEKAKVKVEEAVRRV